MRTISASFGFSIGSSAPASSNHTPVVEEHPAKRRKTVLQAEIDSIVETAVTHVIPPTKAQCRAKPARKRWQAGEEPVLAKQEVDAEDSFVALVRSKKTRSQALQYVEASHGQSKAAISPSSAKPRSRKRAAVTAEAKTNATAELVEVAVTADGIPETAQVRAKKAKNVARKGTGAHRAGPEQITSVVEAPSMRKVRPKVDVPPMYEEDQAHEIGDRADNEQAAHTVSNVKASTVTKATSRRQPLQHSDVNAHVRSVSSEKKLERRSRVFKVNSNEGNVIERAMLKVLDPRPLQHCSIGPAEAHSADGKDAIVPSVASTSSDVRDCLASKTVQSCIQATRSTKRPTIRSSKQLKCTQSVTEPQKYVGSTEKMHDEDIDWLFETQPPKALKPTRRSGAKVQTAMHPRRETPDVDLDGLLSEIASLANGYDQRTDERHKLDNGAKGRVRRRIALGQ